MSIETLTILLDGITAGDYLTWVRDPEPPALGHELRSIAVEADPLGDRIDVELVWDRPPSEPRCAAAAAGFVLGAEVVAVLTGEQARRLSYRRSDWRSRRCQQRAVGPSLRAPHRSPPAKGHS